MFTAGAMANTAFGAKLSYMNICGEFKSRIKKILTKLSGWEKTSCWKHMTQKSLSRIFWE